MAFTKVLAEVIVADHDAALDWYGRLFDRQPDERPMDGLAGWRLTDTGWLQVFHDPDRAGGCTVTLGVDDLDSHDATLAARGLQLSRSTTSRGQRLGTLTDLDGNLLVLAEEL